MPAPTPTPEVTRYFGLGNDEQAAAYAAAHAPALLTREARVAADAAVAEVARTQPGRLSLAQRRHDELAALAAQHGAEGWDAAPEPEPAPPPRPAPDRAPFEALVAEAQRIRDPLTAPWSYAAEPLIAPWLANLEEVLARCPALTAQCQRVLGTDSFNLGYYYGKLAETRRQPAQAAACYDQALAAYEAALTVQRPDAAEKRARHEWASTQSNLAHDCNSIAVLDLHKDSVKLAYARRASAVAEAALREVLREDDTWQRQNGREAREYWADTKNVLGIACKHQYVITKTPADRQRAIGAYNDARRVATPTQFPNTCWRVASNLGRLYFRLAPQVLSAARAAYEEAVAAVETLWCATEDDEARRALAAETDYVYGDLIACCLAQGDDDSAARHALAHKGRALADQLATPPPALAPAALDGLARRWAQLEPQRQELDHLYWEDIADAAPGAAPPPATRAATRQTRATRAGALRTDLATATNTLLADETYRPRVPGPGRKPFTPKRAKQLADDLGGGHTLVEYVQHADGWGAVVVTAKRVRWVSFPKKTDLGAVADQVVKTLRENRFWSGAPLPYADGNWQAPEAATQPPPATGRWAAVGRWWGAARRWVLKQLGLPRPALSKAEQRRQAAEWDRRLAEAYDAFIRPLRDYLPAVGGQLVIAPTRALHGVPFQALCYPDDAGKLRYLCDDYAMTFAPSLSVVAALYGSAPPPAPAPTLLSVLHPGPPRHELSAAPAEATAVCAAFAPHTTELHHADAQPRRLFEELATRTYGVIHIVCHGVFDVAAPRFSNLLLADNRRLLVDDIRLWVRLPNRPLVVLSACETNGVGAADDGTAAGLSWAFLEAGAGSVIASQWRVDDEGTSELFQAFYALRADPARTDAQALQAAIAQVRNLAGGTEPYLWAAFQVMGLPRTRRA